MFELHPENQPPHDVLLSQLGRADLLRRYPNNSNPAAAPAQPGPNQPNQPPGNRVPAQVQRVVDGDTIVVSINGQQFTVRYIGINMPETVDPNRPVECFGPEASAENRRLVEGKTVMLEKDVSETDSFGRLLRYVYVGDLFVNAELVKGGYAHVSTFPPDVKHQDTFLSLERVARSAGIGLWGQACRQTPAPTPTTPPLHRRRLLRRPGRRAAREVVAGSVARPTAPQGRIGTAATLQPAPGAVLLRGGSGAGEGPAPARRRQRWRGLRELAVEEDWSWWLPLRARRGHSAAVRPSVPTMCHRVEEPSAGRGRCDQTAIVPDYAACNRGPEL